MSGNNHENFISAREINNTRQHIELLRAQLASGHVDIAFLNRQLEKITGLLEHIEHEQNRRQRSARFEALYNVSRLLGSSLDVRTVLDQVMDAILQLTGAERGFIMLRDDDGEITVTTARNLDQQTLTSEHFRYSQTIVNQVLDSGEPVLTTNAAEDPRFSTRASIVSQSLRSIMATPLRARGRVIGVVYVDNRVVANLFQEDDLAALDAFAGQAAIAIDNARLFGATDQELQARIEELTQLRRIDMQLNETLDADKAMQIALEWACRVSDASTGYMGLVEGESTRIRAAHTYGVHAGDTQNRLHELYPEALEVAASGKTQQVEIKHPEYTHTLIVPVRREHRVIAVIILNRNGAFSAGQQDMVERVVSRAAVAIDNARLYAAVRAADIAKSEFVGIVAHDLKVPMTNIMGYADLTLMEGGLNERQVDFQNKIRDTVQRMEILVSDLADISRIESGNFYMTESDVIIGTVVQALKDSTFTQLKARGHTLVEEIDDSLPALRVDYYRLLQVLTNLMSNAIKYTPDGGTITLRISQNGDDRIEFSVSDTGVGMSPEELAMLGTKFWRADGEFTRLQSGSGLGFAISRALVEQMGGRIRVESEVNRGSTFTFDIPIRSA